MEKPILRVSKSDELDPTGIADLFTADDVRKAIETCRDGWGVYQQLKDGLTPQAIAKAHDKEIKKRVTELFPEAIAFMQEHRSIINYAHVLRKIYANYGYSTLGDPSKETFSAWASRYLGWRPSSGLQTSVSYSDIQIIRIPPKMAQISEASLAVQKLLKEVSADVEQKKKDEDEEEWDSPLFAPRARIRAAKKRGRPSITINGVELTFNKRQRLSTEQRLEKARNARDLLKEAGFLSNP